MLDKSLVKLIEVASSGIGSIAGPMVAGWQAEKRAKAKVIEAKGDAEILLIHANAAAEARQVLDEDGIETKGTITLNEGVKNRIEFQERKRQANIVSVVNRAAHQLEGEDVPDTEPDHDWAARFFNEVQDVSTEEMQELWASVLARKVRDPRSTSIRALSVLKDLDVTTARSFSTLCSAAVYLQISDKVILDARVPSLGQHASQNSLEKFGLSFSVLSRLNEHSLIIPDYNSYFKLNVLSQAVDQTDFRMYHQGKRWDLDLILKGNEKRELKIHGVSFTVVGHELSQVVSREPMEDYTAALREFFQSAFQVQMRPFS